LGLVEGATENAAVVKDLLEDLVTRGLDPNRKRLFVIEGSKALRAAWRLDPEDGKERIRQQARQLEKFYPSAAASLLEGLDELFTVNTMGLPKALARCLCTTNLIESPNSGVRLRTRRVCNWQDGQMVLRWSTAAFLETEKHFQKIGGYKQLWMLKSYLDELEKEQTLAKKRRVG
jgi:putative transposase